MSLFRISEPGGQIVRDIWQLDFTTFLAGSMKVVVLEVDGRGAGGRGEDWRRMLVSHLGDVDVEDQIFALE